MAAKQEGSAHTSNEPSEQQAPHTLASKFPPKFLEGVDFIETEEDARAVEAATLKIQSTFRGKKFRLKGQAKAGASQTASSVAGDSNEPTGQLSQETRIGSKGSPSEQSERKQLEDKLSKRVSEMQVNDNEDCQRRKSSGSGAGAGAPEEEVERAATKIQAGFKGYKTRKELEGKLATGQGAGGGPSEPTEATSLANK